MNNHGVTLVICCYNSALRLPETLMHIAAQSNRCPCEIVVVDNASTDHTAQVAQRQWKALGRSDVEFTIIKEPRPGLANAREAGIAKARFEVVILCDDDNWLDPMYVQRAFDLMSANPQAGIAGGDVEAKYEVEPPEWFHRHAHLLAIGSQASRSREVTVDPGFVYGAGMIIRKSAYEDVRELGFRPILADRQKKQLTSGGDTEICFAMRLAGWRIFYDQQLRLVHYMPAARITWDYLKSLQYGMGKSSIYFVAYFEHLLPLNRLMPRGLKKSWWFQALATLKALASRTPRALLDSVRGKAGADSVLAFLFQLGRLRQTLYLGSSLSSLYQAVDNFVRTANSRKARSV